MTDNIITAGQGSTINPDPHPLADAPVPTSGTLAVEEGAVLRAGETVGIVATAAAFLGELQLGVNFPGAAASWTWSGTETPKTVRIELPTGHVAMVLCVVGGDPLAELEFDVAGDAQ